MFDEETEQLAGELGLDVVFPPASLRHRLDSKIETTRLGDEAGVPSVPNTMGAATTYPELISLATRGARGRPRGADAVRGLRARRRSSSPTRGTGSGTTKKIVGPRHQGDEADRAARARDRGRDHPARHPGRALMAELTGFPELTPYDGGWCGNDVLPDAAHRAAAALRPRADVRDGRAAAARGLPRILRAGLPRWTRTPARCGSGAEPPGDRRVAASRT